MPEVEHFRLIEEYDIYKFENIVNSLIIKGYQPLGATSTVRRDNFHYFVQSLVKYKKPPKKEVPKVPNTLSYIKE